METTTTIYAGSAFLGNGDEVIQKTKKLAERIERSAKKHSVFLSFCGNITLDFLCEYKNRNDAEIIISAYRSNDLVRDAEAEISESIA